ncbi:hypothetical protein ACFLQ5_03605 [Bacteroidota bacterium]
MNSNSDKSANSDYRELAEKLSALEHRIEKLESKKRIIMFHPKMMDLKD